MVNLVVQADLVMGADLLGVAPRAVDQVKVAKVGVDRGEIRPKRSIMVSLPL
jgi:hypothetical protein